MRQPITYANARSDLPQSDFAKRLAELRITRTFAARSKAQEQDNAPQKSPIPHRREDLSMVAQERPHPVLKPSPALAADVDEAAFNARWEAERQRATPSHSNIPNQGDTSMSDDTKNRPAETLREGSLKAAIWRNESERGAYHSVTLTRSYKDKEGNYHDTSSFRAQDMLGLAELARQAHHHTNDLDREAFKEQRQGQAQQTPSQSHGHRR